MISNEVTTYDEEIRRQMNGKDRNVETIEIGVK